MDQTIMGPLLILLFGGGVGAAFYFVAQRYVGRSGIGTDTNPGTSSTRATDVRR
ncbi:MAG: hypothetical protein RLZZ387_3165 [Chloroflexota bacterium]